MSAKLHTYIICAGGHAKVLIDIISLSNIDLLGVFDDNELLKGKKIKSIPILGSQDKILQLNKDTTLLVNALGNAPNSKNSNLENRKLLFYKFKKLGYVFETIVSPHANVSNDVVVSEGAQIISSATINSSVTIGINSIINTSASIDHDCKVGAHSHVAPGAVLCGGVMIGDCCHIGAGSVILSGLRIGNGAVVGAGAIVLNDVLENQVVIGNPAKVINYK